MTEPTITITLKEYNALLNAASRLVEIGDSWEAAHYSKLHKKPTETYGVPEMTRSGNIVMPEKPNAE